MSGYDDPFVHWLQELGLHQDAAEIVRLGDELDTEIAKFKANIEARPIPVLRVGEKPPFPA